MNNDTKKAMTLYRYNLKLSQELFTIVSCFEIALRNKIDAKLTSSFGNDWLRDAINPPKGIFLGRRDFNVTKMEVSKAIRDLGSSYSHSKLIAELGFGFWRYMYSNPHYVVTNRRLLSIFPNKPISTRASNINHTFIFRELEKVNTLRNRIAHHEPVCFVLGNAIKDTGYARDQYLRVIKLFKWMDIDEANLLYGLDHFIEVCNKIDTL